MSNRRRVQYVEDQPHPTASFTWGNLVNLAAIPVVTALVIFVGQWAVQGESTRRTADDMKAEKIEREKMRESFMASQKQLVDVLGKIDTRLSVTEKGQETAVKQIDKLGDLILKLSPSSSQPPERRR